MTSCCASGVKRPHFSCTRRESIRNMALCWTSVGQHNVLLVHRVILDESSMIMLVTGVLCRRCLCDSRHSKYFFHSESKNQDFMHKRRVIWSFPWQFDCMNLVLWSSFWYPDLVCSSQIGSRYDDIYGHHIFLALKITYLMQNPTWMWLNLMLPSQFSLAFWGSSHTTLPVEYPYPIPSSPPSYFLGHSRRRQRI